MEQARSHGAVAASPSRTIRSEHGFTLVEILISIVLVGILSAVVVVGIANLTSKGSSAACAASADAARAGSAIYFASNQSFPSTLVQMTSSSPPTLTMPNGVSLNSATIGANPPGTVATAPTWTLTMVPGIAGAAPTFVCATAGAVGSGSSAGTSACPGRFTAWVGEYYSTVDLTDRPTVCRDDASLNFDWGLGSPAPGLPNDYFSARWTQSLTFTAGAHTFSLGSDDGSRLYIDGTKVLDAWTDHSYSAQNVTQTLTAGVHLVVVEFYERGGYAAARLTWS